MTAPVEHLFRGGEPVRPEDVPAEVLSKLRSRVVSDEHRGVSVNSGGAIYSLAIRDAPDDGEQVPLAREGQPE